MNTYYLVRHGQDYDNLNGILNGQRDMTLTEVGINQAIESGHKIKDLNLKIDLALTSPLNRSHTTASIISAINNFPTPIVEPLLIERNFGIMTGKKVSDITALCAPDIIKVNNLVNFLNPPEAETYPDEIARAQKLFAKLNDQYKDKKIMLVSHGDLGKMIYCAFYNLDWRQVLSTFEFGNSEVIKLDQNTKPSDAKIIKIKQFNV